MRTQKYVELRDRQMKELNEFPIAYAFDEKQLQEALEKLGATKEECVTIFGHGDIVKKEVQEALLADKDFAVEAFLYEMDNHEYAINYDGDGDVLECFGMDEEELVMLGLDDAYMVARKRHFDHMREWGVF